MSLAGKGVEVAFPFGTSSYTPNRLKDSISSQTAQIHSRASGPLITLTVTNILSDGFSRLLEVVRNFLLS